MTGFRQLSQDYTRIESAIYYLEANATHQPGLAEVAAHVGLSEYHFQRLFSRWAGISPKRFLQFLTKETAKTLLARRSVLSTTFEVGLSSPGRLHDLLIQTEAVTPGEYRSQGIGMTITYGFHPTPFGECLLALTGRGICFLGFVDGDQQAVIDLLRRDWPKARLLESSARSAPIVAQIFTPTPNSSLKLLLRGTNFQLKVWEALLRLPPGRVTSYQGLAGELGDPRAARAVGNAIGHNPVAFLIPCHRVLRKVGDFGSYRYGSARKKAILFAETSQAEYLT